MTRDEAIEIDIEIMRREQSVFETGDEDARLRELAGHNIDRLVRLCGLKLDEPGNVGKQFEDELRAYMSNHDLQSFINWMDEHKIDVVRR